MRMSARKKRVLSVLFLTLIYFPGFNALESVNKRDEWQQPEKIMNAIGVKPGMVIGDIGAGEGYFTFKLSKRVGKRGIIYANDINWRSIERMKRQIEKEGITNIKTILGEANDPLMPDGVLDIALMVNVFHYLEKPVKFLEKIRQSLKEKGLLAIVQWDPQKMDYENGLDKLPGIEVIKSIIKDSGFKNIQIITFLNEQNVFICK